MNFLSKLTQAVTMLPYIVQGVQMVFGFGKGQQKAEAAVNLFNVAANVTEAIAQKDIVDQEAFSAEALKFNNALIGMLNASVWHKSKQPKPPAPVTP